MLQEKEGSACPKAGENRSLFYYFSNHFHVVLRCITLYSCTIWPRHTTTMLSLQNCSNITHNPAGLQGTSCNCSTASSVPSDPSTSTCSSNCIRKASDCSQRWALPRWSGSSGSQKGSSSLGGADPSHHSPCTTCRWYASSIKNLRLINLALDHIHTWWKAAHGQKISCFNDFLPPTSFQLLFSY